MKTEPTAGAMRAAVGLPENSQGWPIENLAEIIDRETALPALLAERDALSSAMLELQQECIAMRKHAEHYKKALHHIRYGSLSDAQDSSPEGLLAEVARIAEEALKGIK